MNATKFVEELAESHASYSCTFTFPSFQFLFIALCWVILVVVCCCPNFVAKVLRAPSSGDYLLKARMLRVQFVTCYLQVLMLLDVAILSLWMGLFLSHASISLVCVRRMVVSFISVASVVNFNVTM